MFGRNLVPVFMPIRDTYDLLEPGYSKLSVSGESIALSCANNLMSYRMEECSVVLQVLSYQTAHFAKKAQRIFKPLMHQGKVLHFVKLLRQVMKHN